MNQREAVYEHGHAKLKHRTHHVPFGRLPNQRENSVHIVNRPQEAWGPMAWGPMAWGPMAWGPMAWGAPWCWHGSKTSTAPRKQAVVDSAAHRSSSILLALQLHSKLHRLPHCRRVACAVCVHECRRSLPGHVASNASRSCRTGLKTYKHT